MEANHRISRLLSHLSNTPSPSLSLSPHCTDSTLSALAASTKSTTFQQALNSLSVSPPLQKILHAIAASVVEISSLISAASTLRAAGGSNDFGDNQLKVDVLSDKAVFNALGKSGVCACASSEEVPRLVSMKTSGKEVYSVSFDPLDGSSIIDANFAVGSIFGVFPGSNLLNVTGRQQIASALAVYGPRLTIIFAIKLSSGYSVMEITYDRKRSLKWWVSRPSLKLSPKAKTFAAANLRAASENEGYKKLLDYYIQQKYTLRYTGGMVPDVVHSFIKGQGVFINPTSKSAKAKLRLLYECAPIAFLIEAAGGKAVNEDGKKSILDIVITDTNMRTGICCGSLEEVDRFCRYISGNYQ